MTSRFSFVIPGVLAGMGRPGVAAGLEEDLWFLKRQGVGAIVSLTLEPVDAKTVAACGFDHLHLPVPDFASPTQGQVECFIAFVEEAKRAGKAVAVHCGAGLGRTGTLLACYLVRLGEGAEEAIESVRRIRPGSIETGEQEQCVRDFCRRRQQDG